MNAPVVIDRIGTLMPECIDPDEKDLRERLLVARDTAQRELARRWESPAQSLIILIGEISGSWAFRNASVEQLRKAREACLDLMRMVVKVEGLDAHG